MKQLLDEVSKLLDAEKPETIFEFHNAIKAAIKERLLQYSEAFQRQAADCSEKANSVNAFIKDNF